MEIFMQLAKELSLKEEQVRKTVELIDEGCTIPFIARYRKEVTGSLDDTVLRALEERLTYLRNLQKRKDEVAKAITDLGLMTDEIFAALEEAQILTEVEDIYRPFKPREKPEPPWPGRRAWRPWPSCFWSRTPEPIRKRKRRHTSMRKKVCCRSRRRSRAPRTFWQRIFRTTPNTGRRSGI